MIQAVICDIQGVLVDIIHGPRINRKLIDFLRENKRKYGLLILHSNSATQSVQYFKELIPELFAVTDNAYFYKSTGYAKPNPKALEYIIKKHNLKAEKTIFIDDSTTNISSARKLGMKTLLYENFEEISTLKNLLFP